MEKVIQIFETFFDLFLLGRNPVIHFRFEAFEKVGKVWPYLACDNTYLVEGGDVWQLVLELADNLPALMKHQR